MPRTPPVRAEVIEPIEAEEAKPTTNISKLERNITIGVICLVLLVWAVASAMQLF
jgi:hypothetical protein